MLVQSSTLIRSMAIWEQDGLAAPELVCGWHSAEGGDAAPECVCAPRHDTSPGARWKASIVEADAASGMVTLTAPLLGLPEAPVRFIQMQLAFAAGYPAAAEIWNASDTHRGSLQWQHGCYSKAAASFGGVARQLQFPEGVGLPGLAWEVQSPAYFGRLETSEMFMRTYSTLQLGLRHGLAIPATGDDGIVVLLSGTEQPIARRVELAAMSEQGLRLIGGYCQQVGDLYASTCDVPLGAALMAAALARREPLLATHANRLVDAHLLDAMGAQALLAWPFNDGRSGPMVMSLWV